MTDFLDWASLANDVDEVLGGFAAATLTRSTPGAYDPATSTTAAATVTTQGAKVARFDYAEKDINGTSILAGDQRALLSTVGIVRPRKDDTLTIGADVFMVVESKAVGPALTAVLYKAQLRGVQA